MNQVERLKNIIMSPKNEWETIAKEQLDIKTIALKYLLILALIPAVCTFIGYSVFGIKVPFVSSMSVSFTYALRYAIVSYVSSVIGAIIATVVINLLAPSFGSRSDGNKAFALVVYSYVPMFIAGVFYLIPSLSPLALLAGLYGLYLLYVGLPLMMETPKENHIPYFVVSLIVMIVVGFILSLILSSIFIGSSFY